MRTIEVNRYLESTRSVEGWVFPVDAYLFGLIDEVQKRNQIRGPLFEIGVHHGKALSCWRICGGPMNSLAFVMFSDGKISTLITQAREAANCFSQT